MLRPRIIPCLLIHKGGLVKTQQFNNHKYIGDPINAVRIFNEKEADELIVLDIDATVNGSLPNFELIQKIAAECSMPLCYGGGVTTADQASRIIDMGVEKVAVSAAAIANPRLLTEMAAAVGCQSVVAVVDIRKKTGLFSKGYEVCSHNAKKPHKIDPISLIKIFQESGAGEIVINAVHQDGLMQGYDLDFACKAKEIMHVPMTLLGGAGSLEDLQSLFNKFGTVGAAAGSLFVFKGKYRAVLINYPSATQKSSIFRSVIK